MKQAVLSESHQTTFGVLRLCVHKSFKIHHKEEKIKSECLFQTIELSHLRTHLRLSWTIKSLSFRLFHGLSFGLIYNRLADAHWLFIN